MPVACCTRSPAGHIHILDTPGDWLEGSLGMLGIVTEVTLEVVPQRKVAVKQLQVWQCVCVCVRVCVMFYCVCVCVMFNCVCVCACYYGIGNCEDEDVDLTSASTTSNHPTTVTGI